MLIDTHCHLFDKRFDNLDVVIDRARDKGVEKIIIPGLDVATSKQAVKLAERYDGVYAMVGIHPETIDKEQSIEEQLEWIRFSVEEIRELTKDSKKNVGIGEIGLDFYRDREKKTKIVQVQLFKLQLKLALELNMPVMIHMRESEEEMREILLRQENLSLQTRGQFHCFGASEEMLKLILEKGFYVSFCGNVTYKSAGDLRDLVKKTPLDRLLLETDSPYLIPEPLRGRSKINEPSNVRIIAEFIAKLHGVSFEELVKITTKNTKCLYSRI